MATIELTRETFEPTIESNDIVLVDFWASWCGPCRTFAPVFEAQSEKTTDMVFAKVDTEAQPELAQGFQVRAIPTLMVFRDKILIFEQAGALPAPALEELVDKVRALDMDEVRAKIAEQSADKN